MDSTVVDEFFKRYDLEVDFASVGSSACIASIDPEQAENSPAANSDTPVETVDKMGNFRSCHSSFIQ